MTKATVGFEMARNCVITIQGGGALGIDLIGQLQGVVGKRSHGDREMDVLGIAGTSAGAIIAVLMWAGYTPFSIRDIVKDTFSPNKREAFFGRFETHEIASFAALLNYLDWCKRSIEGNWFSKLQVALSVFTRKRWAWRKRGLIQADGFEDTIDELLRAAPLLQGRFDGPAHAGRHLTFGDIANAVQLDLVPLFLMVTDLDRRGLVAIFSLDPDCRDLPVARAVRASAGFPILFRPVELGPHRVCIDGGVISNAPSWVFSRAFRERLRKAGRQGNASAARLATAPWCHISLRLAQDRAAPATGTPFDYLSALWSMLSGIGRRTLEDTMFDLVANRGFKVIPPGGNGPRNVLDFGFLTDRAKIDESFERGRAAAQAQILEAAFASPDPRIIGPILIDLVLLATEVLEPYLRAGSLVRANVFLSVSSTHMRIAYAVNMDDHADIKIEVGQRRSVTSLCFESGTPLLANLVTKQLYPNLMFPGAEPFAPQTHPDRTWLLSVPILDSLDIQPITADGPLSLDFTGPVLAVLNLDASIAYDRAANIAYDGKMICSDPRLQATHPAVRAVFDAAKIAAFRVAAAINTFWTTR